MSLECPFSPKSANEKVVRLTAFLTVVLMLAALFSSLRWIALLLTIDFFIRGFTSLPFSPVRRGARALAKALRLEPKMINAGPKIFAARIGCVFCATIAAFSFTGFNSVARILAELMVLLAGLEAFMGICVGCHMYSLLQTLKKSFKSKE
jgi:hypothetical protein